MEQQVDVTTGASLVRRMEVGLGHVTASRFPPNLRLPGHSHPHATVAVIVAGGFGGRYRGGDRECATSSVIVEPAGEAHANSFGPGETTILTVSLRAGAVGDATEAAARRLSFRRDPYADLVARRAVAELDRPDDVTPMALEAAALELVARVTRASRGERRPAWLGTAREYLHDRFAEGITLAEVAHAACVEPERLGRAFRRTMGEPVSGYVRRIRVEAAATLLATTDLPISRVAADVGFADQSHLTRWFTRYLGTTPGRYREAHRR